VGNIEELEYLEDLQGRHISMGSLRTMPYHFTWVPYYKGCHLKIRARIFGGLARQTYLNGFPEDNAIPLHLGPIL
jgi:hypothetical protein